MLEWLFGRSKEDDKPEKPKKKQSSAEETENKWKYDFIVQFMSGPLWKTSILDFVDYHCVVFDSEEENKFEYTTLHNKFKELVASLFDTMMQEVELDDQKLAELLDRGFNSKQKKIFQQLILADDFLKFKRLMVNRNKTLEAEAIKALHEGQNSKKKAAKPHKGSSSEHEVIKKSMLSEQERIQKLEQQEEQELRMILEMSKKEADEAALIKNLEEKVALNETTEAAKLEANPPPSVSEPQQPEYFQKPSEAVVIPPEPVAVPMPSQARRNRRSNMPLEPLAPVKQPPKVEESSKEEVKQVKEEVKLKPVVEVVEEKAPSIQEKPSLVEEKPVVVEKAEVESMDDRKRRLMQQRQRIRQKKEEERKKQMAEEGPGVQTIVLQDDGIHETQLGVVEEKKVSKEQLERRRELMKKIKNRIVDDF